MSEQLILGGDYEENNAIFADLKPRIVREFFAFHRENPKVYDLFLRFSEDAMKTGRERFGAAMVLQRIRWYTMIETTDEVFKINNNHHPCYARLLMLRDPKFKGFFETRRTPGSVPVDYNEGDDDEQ